MSSDLTDLQAADRALWAAGNYDAIAELFWEAGAVVAGATVIDGSMKVLDVGTGTGSAAIRAAQAGGAVTGLDISGPLLDGARRRAEEAGVSVEWVEGDAQALTYEDDSFDRVLTAFGTIFAADHGAAAHELVRVCKPGGEVVMANWAPESYPARMMALLDAHRPPAEPNAVSFSEWGTHGHVRRELGGQLVLAIEPHSVDFVFASADAMLAFYEESFPPLVVAKSELDDAAFDALRADVRALIEELDAGDGETRITVPYVLVVGHKPVADLRPNC
jgi:ubiquinone/menaquinone biosynthesis C-methylase UbiE